MSATTQAKPRGKVTFDCRCGEKITIPICELGQTRQCSHCQAYLRPGLSMILSPTENARNITVVCTCGHFVVSEGTRTGRVVSCAHCKQRLKIPPAQKRPVSDVPLRIPAGSLRRMIRAAAPREAPVVKAEPERNYEVSFRVQGQRKCLNPNCAEILPTEARVCHFCGANQVTGKLYPGKDPGRDRIKGLWPGPNNW